MIIPMRCLSCGKPISHLWEDYKKRTTESKEERNKVIDELGLKRYCCRAVFLGHTDLIETIARFKKE